MNDECRMMNDEWRRNDEWRMRRSARRRRVIHHSSFITHNPPARSGVTLLEVLVSVFIISLGLLGVAALIPLGKLAISQTNIADRTGALGRAALRDVEVRRMLDYTSWFPVTPQLATPGVLCFDPLGRASTGIGAMNLGGATNGTVPRYSFGLPMTLAQADPIFRCSDELIFVKPEDMNPPQSGERPVPNGFNEGNFSWFMTVCPSRSDIALNIPVAVRRDYDVSVVVCHKRDLTGVGEFASANNVNFLGQGYGGGTIQLDPADAALLDHVETDQWVMLADAFGTTAKWYRVVGVGNVGMPYISLVGSDWNASLNTRLVIVEGVTGVYTTTIHLDNDCTWTR